MKVLRCPDILHKSYASVLQGWGHEVRPVLHSGHCLPVRRSSLVRTQVRWLTGEAEYADRVGVPQEKRFVYEARSAGTQLTCCASGIF